MNVVEVIIRTLAVIGGVNVIGFCVTFAWFLWEAEHAPDE